MEGINPFFLVACFQEAFAFLRYLDTCAPLMHPCFIFCNSSKPVAVAFCEAKLLSMLRVQQWNQTQETRPEIFVWVRNMRSTAYRRALATIALEQQKGDLEFL